MARDVAGLPAGVIRLIQQEAARAGCTMAEVLDGRRYAAVIRARRRVILKLRERGLSAQQIGAYLGRHHSTVLYQLGTLRNRKPSTIVDAPAADAAPVPDLSGEWAI